MQVFFLSLCIWLHCHIWSTSITEGCWGGACSQAIVHGQRKKAWYTLLVHAQFPQGFWVFGNFRKICFITLTSAKYADFSCMKDACHWPCSVRTMTRERQRYSDLYLQELSTRLCIPAKHCSTWLMQSLLLKFADRFEWSIAGSYRRSNIVFWLKDHPYGSQRGYNCAVRPFSR